MIKEWEGIYYNGNVLAPPSYAAIKNFTQKCEQVIPPSTGLKVKPYLGYGTTEEFIVPTDEAIEHEVELKMAPFREMHPGSTFKHVCPVVQCEVCVQVVTYLYCLLW